MSPSPARPWEAPHARPPRPEGDGSPRPAAVFIYPTAREERQPETSAEGAGEAAAREAAAFEQGRAQGRAEARAEAQAETQARMRRQADAELSAERAAIGMVVGAFARARAGYFMQVEGEVVRLALSIARRVLHREAQVDPLLLRGAVRLALERLGQNTRVTLRVAPGRAEAWRRAFAAPHGLPPEAQAPEVAEDAALGGEDCVLETGLGETRCAVEEQLQEIEQGFFDLIAERSGLPSELGRAAPAAAPAPGAGRDEPAAS